MEAKPHAFLTLRLGCKWVVSVMLWSFNHDTCRRYAVGSSRSAHCIGNETFYTAED